MSSRKDRAARREKRTRIIRIVLLLLFISLIISAFYWAGRKLYGDYVHKRMNLVAVSYGTLNEQLYGQALVINREYLVTASQSGRFENLVSDNDRVRKGQSLGYLIADNTKVDVVSPYTGIFTTDIDGLEDLFQNQVLNAIGPESYHYQARKVNADSNLKTGDLIGKIIDNLRPNSLIIKAADNIDLPFKAGDRVQVWSGERQLGIATVRELRQDSITLAWLEMDNFSEALLGQRYINVMVENIDKPGFLVPIGAIIKNGQENIVYCYRDGKIYPQRIIIIKEKEGQALIKGLELNEMIVGYPQIIE